MPRKLLIMRHAKSDWDHSHQHDFDRTLAPRGKKDAPRMGQWIVENFYTPSKVICSPATRVRETIQLAGDSWKLSEAEIFWDKNIYAASLSDLLAIVVADTLNDDTTLIAGHNPGLEELIFYLSGGKIPALVDGNLMPTAAITILELSDNNRIAEHGGWQIVDYIKPKLLPDHFK